MNAYRRLIRKFFTNLVLVTSVTLLGCSQDGDSTSVEPTEPDPESSTDSEVRLLQAGEAVFEDEEFLYLTEKSVGADGEDDTPRFSTTLCDYVAYHGPVLIGTVDSARYLTPEETPVCELDYAGRPSEVVLKVEANAVGEPVPLSLDTVYIGASPWLSEAPRVGQRVLVALAEDRDELFWMQWIPLALSPTEKGTGVEEDINTTPSRSGLAALPTNFGALSRELIEARADGHCSGSNYCTVSGGWPACVRDPGAYNLNCRDGYVADDAAGYPVRQTDAGK